MLSNQNLNFHEVSKVNKTTQKDTGKVGEIWIKAEKQYTDREKGSRPGHQDHQDIITQKKRKLQWSCFPKTGEREIEVKSFPLLSFRKMFIGKQRSFSVEKKKKQQKS
jgi:hypothetical protein